MVKTRGRQEREQGEGKKKEKRNLSGFANP